MKGLSKLGIIAGQDKLPSLLVSACEKASRPYHVITFKGQVKPDDMDLSAYHTEVPLGAAGKTIQILKSEGCEEVVMAGGLSKPSLFDLKPDATGLKLLAGLKNKHDNNILEAICDLLSKEGLRVVGAHEVAPELLASEGVWTKLSPNETQQADVQLGVEVASKIGEMDIGQAVIIKDGVVLGIEAVEGTAKLIERCASLRGKSNKGGVLVKVAKPQQTDKADLPSIGVKTIESLLQYNYDGIAVMANKTLVIDAESIVKLANKNKIFVVGIK